MVDVVAAVGVALTVIGVGIALVEIIVEFRNFVRSRQAELFIPYFYDRLMDKEFWRLFHEILYAEWKDYDDWSKKWGPETNPAAFAEWSIVGAYFEGMGVLVKRKLIDISLVDDLVSIPVLWYWEKVGPLVKEWRERIERPDAWEWSEYLYNEMKKREQEIVAASK